MGDKLVTIAKIMFALVFIIVLAEIFTQVITFGNRSNRQLQAIENNVIEAELAPYDDTIVSGDVVIATINKLQISRNGTKMEYTVDSVNYGYTSSSDYVTYDTSKDASDANFISPVANYHAELNRNANGVVIGVDFTSS